ncbi:unnamed protein product, partial [Ectocarpus fasciculatus]
GRADQQQHLPHEDEVPPTPDLHPGSRQGELRIAAGRDRRDGRVLPDPAAGRASLAERPRLGSDHLGRVLSPNVGGLLGKYTHAGGWVGG